MSLIITEEINVLYPIITSILTIITGVLIFVLGQIILKFFIEPILKQKEVFGLILSSLIKYAYVIGNPGLHFQHRGYVKIELRKLASDLYAKTKAIPAYTLASNMKLVPRYKAIIEVHKHLIFLSNSLKDGNALENQEKRERIEHILS